MNCSWCKTRAENFFAARFSNTFDYSLIVTENCERAVFKHELKMFDAAVESKYFCIKDSIIRWRFLQIF